MVELNKDMVRFYFDLFTKLTLYLKGRARIFDDAPGFQAA